MALPQILQGTWEELSAHADSLGERRLTLVVPADGEAALFDEIQSPEVVATQARLEELLLAGLASPSREMTGADWEQLKQRATKRAGEDIP